MYRLSKTSVTNYKSKLRDITEEQRSQQSFDFFSENSNKLRIARHSALRLVGLEPEPSQATDMTLACCFLGKVLRVVCHYFPPLFRHSNLLRQVLPRLHDARDPSGEG